MLGYSIAVSVIAIMISVGGIVFGLGYAFDNNRLKMFGRDELVQSFINGASEADPMDILRTAVSCLSLYDTETNDSSEAANLRKSIRLISKVSSVVAAIGRCRKGGEYVKPDPSMSHTENFLYMLNGAKPSQEQLKPIEMMFMLQAEHSSNASTFSALVTGATLSDLYSAATSGIATLKGPLHGGADEEALRMMRAIGAPGNTEQYINDALAGRAFAGPRLRLT